MIVSTTELKAVVALARRISDRYCGNVALRPRLTLDHALGVVEVEATDLTAFYHDAVAADAPSPRTARPAWAVDFGALGQVLKTSGKSVELRADAEGNLVVDGTTLLVELASCNGDDFPLDGWRDSADALAYVQASALAAGLHSVEFAASRLASRQQLMGVQIEVKGTAVRLAASDGKRIAFADGATDHAAGAARGIVPLAVVGDVVKLLGRKAGTVGLHVDAGNAMAKITWGGATITTRLLQGELPDYASCMPKDEDFAAIVEVAAAALAAAARKVSAAVPKSRKAELLPVVSVDFPASGEELVVELAMAAFGRASARVPASAVKGPEADLRVHFSVPFLVEALEALDDDAMVTWGVQKGRGAAVLRTAAWTYGFMPVIPHGTE